MGGERYIQNTTEAGSSEISFISPMLYVKWDVLNANQFLALDHIVA